MVIRDREVLLGMKKRGFGEGRWNGFGGKVDGEEDIESAAHRELFEESGLRARKMCKVGVLDFSFENDPKILEVHVFRVDEIEGEPAETEEMRPQWFAFDDVPFEQMWSDDEQWFPHLLEGRLFKGKFLFDRPSDATYSAKILAQELFEVQEL